MPRESRMSRLAILATVAMLLGSLLTVRLWFLQAVDAPGLEQRVWTKIDEFGCAERLNCNWQLKRSIGAKKRIVH